MTLVILAVRTPAWRVPLLGGGAALLVAFIILVVRHSRAEDRRDHANARLGFARESVAAIRRDWANLPVPPSAVTEDHPYAIDLDLAGDASLFQLLDRGATPLGRAMLQQWLLEPAAPAAIARRQEAVRVLATDAAAREDLAGWARLLDDEPEHLARFLEWAEGERWLLARPALLWTARALTVLSFAAIGVWAAGLVDMRVWIVTSTIAIALSWACRKPIAATFDRAANSGQAVQRYGHLLDRAATLPADASLVAELQSAFQDGGEPAPRALAHFARLADRSNLRYSAAIFYLAIQATTLWDFHVLAALERWRDRHGRHVRAWLRALAEIEALAALAGLAHDNPAFTFPQVDGGAPSIDAQAIGHPLLADGVRVANDVSLGPPGTFLLITGSNMSGKSTLLRAIGVNLVLAQAGAPVCASALRLTPVRLFTSMRVHDSLAQGVSYFMAALTRLKAIVDASRAGDRPLLYLLDEVLQGTNSAERQIAVRRIAGFLLKQHAIGAVTSHDLDLASVEPLASAARLVHFAERFRTEDGREVMTFDYVLQPGVATSRNALKLMELIGLPTSDDPAAV